jgi:hypothetical protein
MNMYYQVCIWHKCSHLLEFMSEVKSNFKVKIQGLQIAGRPSTKISQKANPEIFCI